MAARQMAPARRHTPDAVFSLTLDGTSCEKSSPIAPRLAALRARPETRSTTPCAKASQGEPRRTIGWEGCVGGLAEMEQGQHATRNHLQPFTDP